jgi:hypothetical protein
LQPRAAVEPAHGMIDSDEHYGAWHVPQALIGEKLGFEGRKRLVCASKKLPI